MRAIRVLYVVVAFTLLVALLGGAKPVDAQVASVSPVAEGAQFVPGEIVVGFASGLAPESYATQAAALATEVGATVVKAYGNLALLSVSADADVMGVAGQLAGVEGVAYAEPNYIYSIPTPVTTTHDRSFQEQFVVRKVEPSAETDGKDLVAIPIADLQAMRSVRNGKVMATYPNDPYLWWNPGYWWVGADIVWINTTPSAGVCVLDTGVDYLHKDLYGNVVKGYDFVNGDADPMDDYGHGTHVAGIIAAKRNNRQGIAGVSTGKVVAVKVLGSQGWGTNFDIASGINYCANRSDVKILNLSLGGGSSNSVYDSIDYAVNVKNKLVVAAAGNNNTDEKSYPAGYADYPEFTNKLLAVAASGMWVWDDVDEYWYLDQNCRAEYSNYGDWVNVVAPGTDIYSTTPWDKAFYMNWFYGYFTRYDTMSGTSMAAPFVAAAAARRWGYKPLDTNNLIGAAVISAGWNQTWDYEADGACWPASMDGKYQVNVAALLDRGIAYAQVYDSTTGLPLSGAKLYAYQGSILRGTGVITPNLEKADSYDPDPNRIYTWPNSGTDIINLPAGSGYAMKVSKAGYTYGIQPAFQHVSSSYSNEIYGGGWSSFNRTAIPPLSSNIDVVLGWWKWCYDTCPDYWDLDLDVWLPSTPNPLDMGQPAKFIVGFQGNDFGYMEGDSFGAMTNFPFARLKRDGGGRDSVPFETITISSRKTHSPVVANSALPYYPGTYTVMVTDYGQTIDHDLDAGTANIPVMGPYDEPYVYVWKNGIIRKFVQMGYTEPGDACNAHWWKALTITSGLTGAPTYTEINQCGDGSIAPY